MDVGNIILMVHFVEYCVAGLESWTCDKRIFRDLNEACLELSHRVERSEVDLV